MTTKYDRNTLVPFEGLRNYSELSGETREHMESLIDPELLTLTEGEADKCEYPLHAYTRAVAFARLPYASVYLNGNLDEVMIREVCFGPGEDGKLLLRVLQAGHTGRVPLDCIKDSSKLLGEVISTDSGRYIREIIDVYQTPRSGRLYVALALQED